MSQFRCLLPLVVTAATALAESQSAAPPKNPAAPDGGGGSPATPRISFNYVHVDGAYIAMTFDDGPQEKLTPKLLDLLAQHHVKATFFVIGQNVAEHPEIVARAAREGHEIGNHSWSHPNLAKMSEESIRRQLRQTDDAIRDAIGRRPTLMRPPYGNLTTRQKQWVHQEFGYRIILWDVDPFDWKRPGPAVICNRIMTETRPGSIVLSHDIHAGTIQAMPDTLNQLEAKGYKFVTVSELIAMAKPQTPAPSTAGSEPSPAPGSTGQAPKPANALPSPAG